MSRRFLPPLAVAFTFAASQALSGCEDVVAQPPFDTGLDAELDAEDSSLVDGFGEPDVAAPEVPSFEPDVASIFD